MTYMPNVNDNFCYCLLLFLSYSIVFVNIIKKMREKCNTDFKLENITVWKKIFYRPVSNHNREVLKKPQSINPKQWCGLIHYSSTSKLQTKWVQLLLHWLTNANTMKVYMQ